MVRAAVDDAEGVARRGEVKINLLHHRMIVVLKINGHHAAHGGPHLVQQPAGLAEIDIFRVLPDLGQLHRGAFAIMEQAVENVPQQHLQSSAGAEAAALEYVGNRIGIDSIIYTTAYVYVDIKARLYELKCKANINKNLEQKYCGYAVIKLGSKLDSS